MVRADCTYGLKKFAAVEEARVLSQLADTEVPVSKFFWNEVLYCAVCESSPAAVRTPVSAPEPVPEMNGLLMGVVRESYAKVCVRKGSYCTMGKLALELLN